MPELWELSVEEIARRVRGREVVGGRGAGVLPGPHRRGRAADRRLSGDLRGGGPRPRRGDRPPDRRRGGPRAARRRAGGAQGQSEPRRARPHLRLAHPRRLRGPVHRHRRRAAARRRRRAGRAGQHGRVRHGLVVRELGVSDRPATRGTSPRCPAAPAAARRRRWRRAACRSRSARTPAARSASRRRSAAWWASSPPTAGCPATAWSPSPRRSTRSARSPATSATPPSASR